MTRLLSFLSVFVFATITLPSHAKSVRLANALTKSSAGMPAELTIIGYHEITTPTQALIPNYAVTPQQFEQQLLWLKRQNFHFVSMDEVLAARAGKQALPAKAVLLSFDDGYASFYQHAYPLIKHYNIPVVLALVGNWLVPGPNEPVDFDGKRIARSSLLSWAQLREMHDSGLVEIASHTYALHDGILANPQGNMQPAVTARRYDPASKSYESDQAYRLRLYNDFKANNDLFIKQGLNKPRVMVWPYGRYNSEAQALAGQLGMPVTFTLDDGPNLPATPLAALRRILVERSMTLRDLGHEINIRDQQLSDNNRAQKIMHIDLDYIYDPDPEQQERNLGHLLDRIVAMQVNTVYLQAFADPDANGSASMVYFPNRNLPMRADLFNRVTWQIRSRTQVRRVYAWMPLLAWELPASSPAAKDTVLAETSDNRQHLNMGYHRLSPFSALARQTILEIYQDLAKSVPFDGILFHDDATLSDYEDASPKARTQYAAWGLPGDLNVIRGNEQLLQQWTALKTRTLDEFALSLAAEVRKQQPSLLTARNLYAQVALKAYAENWYAQSLENSLRNYDFTAIMAMPYMEQAKDPDAFYNSIVKRVKSYPEGLKKTVFELQATNWRNNTPVPSDEMAQTISKLYLQGVRHIGYYPDDPVKNHPDPAILRPIFDSKSSAALP